MSELDPKLRGGPGKDRAVKLSGLTLGEINSVSHHVGLHWAVIDLPTSVCEYKVLPGWEGLAAHLLPLRRLQEEEERTRMLKDKRKNYHQHQNDFLQL